MLEKPDSIWPGVAAGGGGEVVRSPTASQKESDNVLLTEMCRDGEGKEGKKDESGSTPDSVTDHLLRLHFLVCKMGTTAYTLSRMGMNTRTAPGARLEGSAETPRL